MQSNNTRWAYLLAHNLLTYMFRPRRGGGKRHLCLSPACRFWTFFSSFASSSSTASSPLYHPTSPPSSSSLLQTTQPPSASTRISREGTFALSGRSSEDTLVSTYSDSPTLVLETRVTRNQRRGRRRHLAMAEEQINQERRVSFGIGGAGNLRMCFSIFCHSFLPLCVKEPKR